jgi:putative transposase
MVFTDRINVKIRESQVANHSIGMALAVAAEGHWDILRAWAGGEGGEGAKHWLRVLTELKNRSLEDVLMLVCDGLKGLPGAVGEVWPQTVVQTCAVHLPRASFLYTARQEWDKTAKALKPVHTAPTEDAATSRFLESCEE